MPAAVDMFQGKPAQALGSDHPASHAFACAGDDANDLPYVTRGLLLGTAGVVKVTMRGSHGIDGETVVLTLPAGISPLRVSRVWAAGLTATLVFGLW